MIVSRLLVGLEVTTLFISEMLLSLLKSHLLSVAPGDSKRLIFLKLGKDF